MSPNSVAMIGQGAQSALLSRLSARLDKAVSMTNMRPMRSRIITSFFKGYGFCFSGVQPTVQVLQHYAYPQTIDCRAAFFAPMVRSNARYSRNFSITRPMCLAVRSHKCPLKSADASFCLDGHDSFVTSALLA